MTGTPPRRRRNREVILVKDLDNETLQAIMNAEPPEESKHLDHLMDDAEA
jgi:hypothetical protein